MWRLVFRWLTSTCYSSDFIQLSDDCTELSICETYALFCVSIGNEDMGSSLIDISNSDAEDELELDNPTMASIHDAVDYITTSFKEPLESKEWA